MFFSINLENDDRNIGEKQQKTCTLQGIAVIKTQNMYEKTNISGESVTLLVRPVDG